VIVAICVKTLPYLSVFRLEVVQEWEKHHSGCTWARLKTTTANGAGPHQGFFSGFDKAPECVQV
jgi:hypothetical protein